MRGQRWTLALAILAAALPSLLAAREDPTAIMRGFLQTLHIRRSFALIVEPTDNSFNASTSRVGDSCVVRLSARVERETAWMARRIVAHEACHCYLDYDVLTDSGLSQAPDAQSRESRAELCESALVRAKRTEDLPAWLYAGTWKGKGGK